MGCTPSKSSNAVDLKMGDIPPGGVGVQVVYCGSWPSFGRKYQELLAAAQQRFPGAPLVFSGVPTQKRTGWFEVTVDDALIFSTKAGMGKFNSPEKKERVLNAIEKALESKKTAASQ